MHPEKPAYRLIKAPAINLFSKRQKSLAEVMVMLASEMEEAMIAAGAKAEIDYTHQSLFSLAAPFALTVFNDKDQSISYGTSL